MRRMPEEAAPPTARLRATLPRTCLVASMTGERDSDSYGGGEIVALTSTLFDGRSGQSLARRKVRIGKRRVEGLVLEGRKERKKSRLSWLGGRRQQKRGSVGRETSEGVGGVIFGSKGAVRRWLQHLQGFRPAVADPHLGGASADSGGSTTHWQTRLPLYEVRRGC